MSKHFSLIPIETIRNAIMESVQNNVQFKIVETFLLQLNDLLVDKLRSMSPNGILPDAALLLMRAQAEIATVLNFTAKQGALVAEYTDDNPNTIP